MSLMQCNSTEQCKRKQFCDTKQHHAEWKKPYMRIHMLPESAHMEFYAS